MIKEKILRPKKNTITKPTKQTIGIMSTAQAVAQSENDWADALNEANPLDCFDLSRTICKGKWYNKDKKKLETF